MITLQLLSSFNIQRKKPFNKIIYSDTSEPSYHIIDTTLGLSRIATLYNNGISPRLEYENIYGASINIKNNADLILKCENENGAYDTEVKVPIITNFNDNNDKIGSTLGLNRAASISSRKFSGASINRMPSNGINIPMTPSSSRIADTAGKMIANTKRSKTTNFNDPQPKGNWFSISSPPEESILEELSKRKNSIFNLTSFKVKEDYYGDISIAEDGKSVVVWCHGTKPTLWLWSPFSTQNSSIINNEKYYDFDEKYKCWSQLPITNFLFDNKNALDFGNLEMVTVSNVIDGCGWHITQVILSNSDGTPAPLYQAVAILVIDLFIPLTNKSSIKSSKYLIPLPSGLFDKEVKIKHPVLLSRWDDTGSIITVLINPSKSIDSRIIFIVPNRKEVDGKNQQCASKEILLFRYFSKHEDSIGDWTIRDLQWFPDSLFLGLVNGHGQFFLIPRFSAPCLINFNGDSISAVDFNYANDLNDTIKPKKFSLSISQDTSKMIICNGNSAIHLQMNQDNFIDRILHSVSLSNLTLCWRLLLSSPSIVFSPSVCDLIDEVIDKTLHLIASEDWSSLILGLKNSPHLLPITLLQRYMNILTFQSNFLVILPFALKFISSVLNVLLAHNEFYIAYHFLIVAEYELNDKCIKNVPNDINFGHESLKSDWQRLATCLCNSLSETTNSTVLSRNSSILSTILLQLPRYLVTKIPVLPIKLLNHITVHYLNGDYSTFESELRLGGLDCMGSLVSLLCEQYRLVEAFSILDSAGRPIKVSGHPSQPSSVVSMFAQIILQFLQYGKSELKDQNELLFFYSPLSWFLEPYEKASIVSINMERAYSNVSCISSQTLLTVSHRSLITCLSWCSSFEYFLEFAPDIKLKESNFLICEISDSIDDNKLICSAFVIHSADIDDITTSSTSTQMIESFINSLICKCLTVELLDIFSFKPACDKFLNSAISNSSKLLFDNICNIELFTNLSIKELTIEEVSGLTEFMERLNAESLFNTPHLPSFLNSKFSAKTQASSASTVWIQLCTQSVKFSIYRQSSLTYFLIRLCAQILALIRISHDFINVASDAMNGMENVSKTQSNNSLYFNYIENFIYFLILKNQLLSLNLNSTNGEFSNRNKNTMDAIQIMLEINKLNNSINSSFPKFCPDYLLMMFNLFGELDPSLYSNLLITSIPSQNVPSNLLIKHSNLLNKHRLNESFMADSKPSELLEVKKSFHSEFLKTVVNWQPDNLAHGAVSKSFLSLLSQVDAEKSRWIPCLSDQEELIARKNRHTARQKELLETETIESLSNDCLNFVMDGIVNDIFENTLEAYTHDNVATQVNLVQEIKAAPSVENVKKRVSNAENSLVDLQKQIELEWLKKKTEKQISDRLLEENRLKDRAKYELDKKISLEKLEAVQLENEKSERMKLDKERIERIKLENERIEKENKIKERKEREILEKREKQMKENLAIKPTAIPISISIAKPESNKIISPVNTFKPYKLAEISHVDSLPAKAMVTETRILEMESPPKTSESIKIVELEAKIEKLIELQSQNVNANTLNLAPLRNLLNQDEFDLEALLAECLAPYFTRSEVVNFLGKKLGKNELMAVLLRDKTQIEKVVGIKSSSENFNDYFSKKKVSLFSDNNICDEGMKQSNGNKLVIRTPSLVNLASVPSNSGPIKLLHIKPQPGFNKPSELTKSSAAGVKLFQPPKSNENFINKALIGTNASIKLLNVNKKNGHSLNNSFPDYYSNSSFIIDNSTAFESILKNGTNTNELFNKPPLVVPKDLNSNNPMPCNPTVTESKVAPTIYPYSIFQPFIYPLPENCHIVNSNGFSLPFFQPFPHPPNHLHQDSSPVSNDCSNSKDILISHVTSTQDINAEQEVLPPQKSAALETSPVNSKFSLSSSTVENNQNPLPPNISSINFIGECKQILTSDVCHINKTYKPVRENLDKLILLKDFKEKEDVSTCPISIEMPVSDNLVNHSGSEAPVDLALAISFSLDSCLQPKTTELMIPESSLAVEAKQKRFDIPIASTNIPIDDGPRFSALKYLDPIRVRSTLYDDNRNSMPTSIPLDIILDMQNKRQYKKNEYDYQAPSFLSVADLDQPPSEVKLFETIQSSKNKLVDVVDWNIPSDFSTAGIIGNNKVSELDVNKTVNDFKNFDRDLAKLTEMANSLTRDFETPRDILQALEEQQRIAAINRLMARAGNTDGDIDTVRKQQELVALLIEETEKHIKKFDSSELKSEPPNTRSKPSTPTIISNSQTRYITEPDNLSKKRVSIVESKNTIRTILPNTSGVFEDSIYTSKSNSITNKISNKLSSATILADKLLTDVTNGGYNFVKLYSKDVNKAVPITERYINMEKTL